MNSLTGDFDLAVEVTGPAVNRLIQGMHAAGIFRHLYVRAYQGKHVELLINCPHIELTTAGPPDNITRAIAASRVLYHSRSLTDATDPGLSVIADVFVQVKLFLTNGDPAPLNSDTYLAADWSETTAANINVYSGDPNVVTEVQGALLDFIAADGGGSYPVPAIGVSQPIGSVAFQFIRSYGEWVAVGMNVGGAIKGSKLQLQNNFVQTGEDWALAISSDFAIGQILMSLNAQLGALPPPNGPGDVLLSDTTICVLPNPFGGCIATADQKVFLESLNISLQNGQIAITGTLKQVTYVLVPITITADFQASATLSIGPNQTLQVNVSQPSVQLQDWFAQLLNAVLGGAFTTAISNGIQAALQSSGGSALSNLISASTLQALTSLGGTATVGLSLNLDSVSIVPEAIITQGTLTVQNLNVAPMANVVALRGPSALTLNLNALNSWSPAHGTTSFLWDFGDGSPQFQSSDTVPAVAVSHAWPAPGQYVVNLRVSNESGAATSTQLIVKPGILELPPPQADLSDGPWAVCSQTTDFPVTFTVMASGFPAPDAIVVIRTSTNPDRIVTASANQLGQATFTVNDSMFTAPPPAGSPFNLRGGMLVNAFCGDYQWAWNYLWLWDCPKVLKSTHQLLSKFTDEVLKLSALTKSHLSVAPGFMRDVAISQSVLTNLAQLTARGSSIFPLEMLLGHKREQAQEAQLQKITEQIIKNLHSARAAMEKETQARRAADTHTRLVDMPRVVAAAVASRKKAYAKLSALVRGDDKPPGAKPQAPSRFKITPSHGAALKATPKKREDKP